MTEPRIPYRMMNLPRDKHGRVVPWFVHWVDGKPEFRIIRRDGVTDAVKGLKCWLCGQPMGRFQAFVIGPMCAVNRLSAEPGSHLDCALYSAQVCPFLTTPNMVRRENNLGPVKEPPGTMCLRNPGVTLVWVSRNWSLLHHDGAFMFNIGDPTAVHWFAEGRGATRREALTAVDSGMPILEAECDKGTNPELMRAFLRQQYQAVLPLLPPEDSPTGSTPATAR